MRTRAYGLGLAAFLLLFLLSPLHAGLKWPAFHAQAPPVGAPIVGGNLVYMLTDDGLLYSLDYTTGGQSFPFNLGGPASVPPVSDGATLYVGTDDGQVQAIVLSRTQRLWRYPPQAPAPGTRLQGLAYGGGLVYAVTANQTIALNASTGAVRWIRPLSSGGGPAGADGQRVYVSDGPNLLAFTSDGQPLWTLPAGSLFKTAPAPDPSSGRVYLSTTTGLVLAISGSDGNVLWSYPLNGWAMSSPAPAPGGLVLVGANDGRVRAIDAQTGQMRWSSDVGGAVWGPPALAANNGQSIALVGSQNDELSAINVSDGALLWQYPTSDWAGSPSVGPDGRVALVPAADGTLEAVFLSPMCDIQYPATGQLVGPQVVIRGRAWAWSGVARVRIGVGTMALPPINLAPGSDSFNVSVDLSSLPQGDVPITCLAEDSNGLAETDAAAAKVTPTESPNAPLENLTLTVQSPVEPGQPFQIWARGSDGSDLRGVSLQMAGVSSTFDSPATLTAPAIEGTYTLSASRAGYATATVPLVVRSNNGQLLLLILVAILVVAAMLYWFFIRKKEVAPPSDYSRLQ